MIEKKLISAAAVQLSKDYNCEPSDFFRIQNIFTQSVLRPGQRFFTETPSPFKAVTFGHNAVISAVPSLLDFAYELESFNGTLLFDGKGIAAANSFLNIRGYIIGDIKQYYLPSDNFRICSSEGYKLMVFDEGDIRTQLHPYYKGYDNALMYHSIGSRHDVLAVAAMSGRTILGMAGASSDSGLFWQIGIDVIPECRQKGLGAILVSTLANEVLLREKIPYYGTWPGNVFSQKTALKVGFRPVWTEMTAAPAQDYSIKG